MLGKSAVQHREHVGRMFGSENIASKFGYETALKDPKRTSRVTVNLRAERKNEMRNFTPEMHSTPKSSDLKLEEVGKFCPKDDSVCKETNYYEKSRYQDHRNATKHSAKQNEYERYQILLQDKSPNSPDWKNPKKLVDAFRDTKTKADYLQITEDIRSLSSRPSASPIPTPPDGSPKHNKYTSHENKTSHETPDHKNTIRTGQSDTDLQSYPNDVFTMPDPWSDLIQFDNEKEKMSSFHSHSLRGSVTSERSSRLDPHTYQCYTAGLLHSSGRSEQFLSLQKHYSMLERISEIENRNENIPKRRPKSFHTRGSEVEELDELYFELKEAKKNKEFFSKKPDQVSKQWNPNADRGLLSKEKSLSDLKCVFDQDNSKSIDQTCRYSDRSRFEKFSRLAEKFRSFDDSPGFYETVVESKDTKIRSKSEPRKHNSNQISRSDHNGQDDKRTSPRIISLHGTHIDEPKNQYEVYVQKKTQLANADLDTGIHVRSMSAPYAKQEMEKPLTRTNSSKESFFREPDSNTDVQPMSPYSVNSGPGEIRHGGSMAATCPGVEVRHGGSMAVTYVNENPELRSQYENNHYTVSDEFRKNPCEKQSRNSDHYEHIVPQRLTQSNTLSASVNDNELFSNKTRKGEVMKNNPTTLSFRPNASGSNKPNTPQFEVRNLRSLADNNEFAQGKFANRKPMLQRYLEDTQAQEQMRVQNSESTIRPLCEKAASTTALYSPSQSMRSDYGVLRKWDGGLVSPRENLNKVEMWDNSSMNDSDSTLSGNSSTGTFIINHSDEDSGDDNDANLPDVTKGTEVNQYDRCLQKASERAKSVPDIKNEIEKEGPVRPRSARSQVKLNTSNECNTKFLSMPRTRSGNLREVMQQYKEEGKFARSILKKGQNGHDHGHDGGGETKDRSVVLRDMTINRIEQKYTAKPAVSDKSKGDGNALQYLDSIGNEWAMEKAKGRPNRHLSPVGDKRSQHNGVDGQTEHLTTKTASAPKKDYLHSVISLHEKSSTMPERYYHTVAVPKRKGNTGTMSSMSSASLPRVTRSVKKAPVQNQQYMDSAFKHQTSDQKRASPPVEKHRRRKEEEEEYRRKRLEQLYEEERRRKIQQEEAALEARRHNDFFTQSNSPLSPRQTPSQKSPIPVDRFEETITQSPQGYGIPTEKRRGFQIQGKAKALYNFTAQNPRELPFRKGDILYLLRQIDKHWFEGERYGRVGIFPTNYVEVLTSIEAAQEAALQAEGQARARYNFTGQTNVELTLRKGEIVILLRRVDDNWFEGRSGGRQGIFPVAYVEVMREPSTPLITPAPSVITTPMTGRGTPEMLSPVNYEAPTPPPQPSPGAFSPRNQASYQSKYSGISPQHINMSHTSPGYEAMSPQRYESSQRLNGSLRMDSMSSGSPLSPMRIDNGYSPQMNGDSPHSYSQRSRHSPNMGQKHLSPDSGILRNSGPEYSPNAHVMDTQYDLNRNKPFGPTDEDLTLSRYRAIYAYKPQNEDELELWENDEIYVMEKCDDGWFVGTSGRTGMFGTFPGNYVQRVQ